MTPLFAGPILPTAKQEIADLIQDLGDSLALDSSSKVLPSVGSGSSGVFFLGEASGPNDAQNGQPFTGPYSQIFNKELLPSVGLSRENIYLTNLVKNSQQLGQNLPAKLIAHWSQVVPLEIALIQPKLIVTLGKYAMEFFLPQAKISQIRGQFFELSLFSDFSVPVLFLIHPANAHRFPEQKPQIQQEFLQIKKFLEGKISPQKPSEEFLAPGSESESLF